MRVAVREGWIAQPGARIVFATGRENESRDEGEEGQLCRLWYSARCYRGSSVVLARSPPREAEPRRDIRMQSYSANACKRHGLAIEQAAGEIITLDRDAPAGCSGPCQRDKEEDGEERLHRSSILALCFNPPSSTMAIHLTTHPVSREFSPILRGRIVGSEPHKGGAALLPEGCSAVSLRIDAPTPKRTVRTASCSSRLAADHVRTAPSLALDTCAAYSARTPSL